MKTKGKISLQFRLLAFAAALGFANVYAMLWRAVGLPLVWWAAVVCALLGLLSEWGLFAWVKRTGKERAKLVAEYGDKVPVGDCHGLRPRNDMDGSRGVGRWIWTEVGEEDHEQFWVCSACGEHSYFTSNYCSDCGVKMEQEGEA